MAGQLAGFSSRGPTADFRIKPDVVAPGNAIQSATSKVGVPTQSMADASGYTIAGGTSMATPHVAGASAVLRQIHPAWNPFDVRLALMNTARLLTDPADGKLYSIQDQGAGLIDVAAAASTKGLLYVSRPDLGALATEGSYSFGEVENQRGSITRSGTFRIRDVSGTARTYAISWSPGDGKGRGGVGRALPAAGFTAALSTASVNVPAGGEATFTLTVTADGSVLADGDYEGRIVASAPDQVLRAPVFYRSAHRAVAPYPAPVLDNPADSDNGTIPLAWTSVPSAVGYRLQEATNPGTAVFTDDAESGLGRWTVSGTTPLAWSSSQMKARSPTQSFFALQGPSQDNRLTLTAPVQVPAGASASLSFWTFHDTEPDFDFGHIDASADGSNWTELASLTGLSAGWVRRDVDLSSYAGGPVYVRFRYTSDTIVDAGLYEGWYVDDISISTANWTTIAEPTTNSYTVTGKSPGTYFYRVAGLFDSAAALRAQGPFSNTAAAIVHANLLENGSFEHQDAAGQPRGWTAEGATRYETDPALATQGTRSVSATGPRGGSWTSAPFAVTAGRLLTVRADVRQSATSSAPSLVVAFLGPSGTVVQSLVTAQGTLGALLSTLSGTVAVPPGATQARVVLRGFAPTDVAPAGRATFDNVRAY
jgi:hypothetical protein